MNCPVVVNKFLWKNWLEIAVVQYVEKSTGILFVGKK